MRFWDRCTTETRRNTEKRAVRNHQDTKVTKKKRRWDVKALFLRLLGVLVVIYVFVFSVFLRVSVMHRPI
jgi:hypothetical protein